MADTPQDGGGGVEIGRPMSSTVLSGTTLGIEARIVRVETHIAATISMFHIVGLPDSVVRESRERVYAAIKSSGFRFPSWRITVNLAPAEIRKAGSALDLPIAAGILAAAGDTGIPATPPFLLVGELALDGGLRGVHGVLPMARAAHRAGLAGIVLPEENAEEAAFIDGLRVYPMPTLAETVRFLSGELRPPPRSGRSRPAPAIPPPDAGHDFSEVSGQDHAKRALVVAAAGAHHLLLVGPPGAGKTMLASRIPGILPPMSEDEAIETTMIHSVAGLLASGTGLVRTRPFRAPHHTISPAALVGGGDLPRPGEISLAHNGVLFLDELPEFRRAVLETLRQPVESGWILVSRARQSVRYPARFLLVCAMNPCPCGRLNDGSGACSCAPGELHRYRHRVSGPLLDRIDILVDVPPVPYADLARPASGERSSGMLERVRAAREVQRRRFAAESGADVNGTMGPRLIREHCGLAGDAGRLLETAMTRLAFSARAVSRVLRVARTIADLEGSGDIAVSHLSEAIQLRNPVQGLPAASRNPSPEM